MSEKIPDLFLLETMTGGATAAELTTLSRHRRPRYLRLTRGGWRSGCRVDEAISL
jgi:hypothetical protein